MPRVKGSKVIDGKVVMPEGAKEETKPTEPIKELIPSEPELSQPQGIKITFTHEAIGIKSILWKGNYSKEIIFPQAMLRLKPFQIAEEASKLVVEAVNRL